MIVQRQKRVILSPVGDIGVWCLLAIMLCLTSSVRACDVPVHRYMLERWERDLYRAYYFYRRLEDKEDRAVNQFLEDAGSSFGSHLNLTFRAVDINSLDSVPLADPDRNVWNQHRWDNLPFHLVLSPQETALFRGRLELSTAEAMVRSPARTRIARELSAGKGGLLLLLRGDDERENERAEKDISWLLSTTRKEHGLDVGFLQLSRKDPHEKWLARFLLDAVENPAGAAQCGVFGICGRGRVIAAYLGEGITRRNLVECVRTMNGDCSCELKVQGIGMDLLTDWDWEETIANLPPVTVEPLRSALLGFDDSDESRPEPSSAKLDDKPGLKTTSLFRGRTLTRWGLAFGIVSAVVLGIGLIVIRRRREV